MFCWILRFICGLEPWVGQGDSRVVKDNCLRLRPSFLVHWLGPVWDGTCLTSMVDERYHLGEIDYRFDVVQI